jgi:hypothetical protein
MAPERGKSFGDRVSFTVEVQMHRGATAPGLGTHPGDTIPLPTEEEQGEVRGPELVLSRWRGAYFKGTRPVLADGDGCERCL